MYKKKKNYLSYIIMSTFIIVFVLLFILIINTKELEYSNKIELSIEILGMFFTSLALILTYSSLKNEKEQKHLASKPYLLLNDIDFAIEKINANNSQLDFDFSIVNKGNGIANRISIKVIKKKDKKILFNGNYVRLDVADNSIAIILSSIRDELNTMNKNNGCSYSYSPYFAEMIQDEFYISDYNAVDEYRNLIIEIVYFDIYGKKYKGKFEVLLNDEFDLENCKEELTEY